MNEFNRAVHEVLKKNGYIEDEVGAFESELAYLRLLTTRQTDTIKVEIGRKSTFDRWGNSVDITFNIYEPDENYNLEERMMYFEKLLIKAKTLIEIIPEDFFTPYFCIDL